MPFSELLVAKLPKIVLWLEDSRMMPCSELPVAVLSEMVLPDDFTQIPFRLLRATNPCRMQSSALSVMALSDQLASTTGEPMPRSVSRLSTTTFS